MNQTKRQILNFANYALEAGDPSLAINSINKVLQKDPRDPEALFLLGESYQLSGDLENAIDAYRLSVLSDPKKSEAWTALGLVRLNRLELEDAKRAFNRAIREDPANPEAWMGRCLLRERRSDFKGSDRDYIRASRLDYPSYQDLVPYNDEDLLSLVEEAINNLEDTFQEFMREVDLLVDEIPSDEVLNNYGNRVSPGQIIMYFAYAEQEDTKEWTHMPISLVLYRRNIQRFSENRQELVDELQAIIYHEVGNFFGMSSESSD